MSEDSRLGTLLADRYRLDALLGEGGMGKVYSAEHVLMRKRLAVKILHRALTTVPEVVTRFEREAMAAAHIDHPNVAAATDFGKLPDGSVFLVLEFVEGKSLRDVIASGPVPADRALHVAAQIASALAAAHGLGIVHRDLKPENVMLVDKGGDPDFVKVLDFGIAKVPIGEMGEQGPDGEAITRAGMVFGTPEYMAPEQALGQNVDGRADIYALGVMLYEMLCGTRPFVSKSQVGILGQQLSSPVPPFATRAPGIAVPPSVEQVVIRLLDREADGRPQTAEEALHALTEVLQGPSAHGRLFTKLGGSPRAVLGSEPGLDEERQSGSVPLPSFATEHDSGLIELNDPERAAPTSGVAPPPDRASRLAVDDLLDGAGSEPVHESPPSWIDRLAQRPALRGAVGFVEATRRVLPSPMRKAVRGVPSLVLLFAAGLALSAALIASIALWRVASHSPTPQNAPIASASAPAAVASSPPPVTSARPSPPVVAPESDLKVAEQEGLDALEELAKKRPDDPAVLVALGKAQVNEKKYVEAVASISKALELDPKLNVNESVASLLFMTAQSKRASPATFQLLEGPMGSRGADILYDITLEKNVRPDTRGRAAKFLKSTEFQKVSSPALNIAVALRYTKGCGRLHALLLRAKNVGDARSLRYLEPMREKTPCKGEKSDCFACMRGDNRLDEAIAAIKKRVAD